MKIRNGFVSNSSSSSFVVIGVKYPMDMFTEDLMDRMDAHGYGILAGSEDGWEDPTTMVVGEVMSTNDDYMESAAWQEKDLSKIWDDISEKMGMEGENIVATGTRVC